VATARQRSQRRVQREQSRLEILQAAEEFLRRHPFRELSLEVVMARSGLTRTAFYRHFADVGDLVLQLLGDVGGELYEIGERWAQGAGGDFAGATRRGLQEIVAFFERHGPLVRAVVDAGSSDEAVEQAYGTFLDAFDAMIAGALDGMVARGELAPCDTRSLARALNLMNERYLLDSFGREPFGDPTRAVATLELVWARVIGAG
jgi:AcrR family transcriptional regulator